MCGEIKKLYPTKAKNTIKQRANTNNKPSSRVQAQAQIQHHAKLAHFNRR